MNDTNIPLIKYELVFDEKLEKEFLVQNVLKKQKLEEITEVEKKIKQEEELTEQEIEHKLDTLNEE